MHIAKWRCRPNDMVIIKYLLHVTITTLDQVFIVARVSDLIGTAHSSHVTHLFQLRTYVDSRVCHCHDVWSL